MPNITVHVTRITTYEIDQRLWDELDMEALDDAKEIDTQTTAVTIERCDHEANNIEDTE